MRATFKFFGGIHFGELYSSKVRQDAREGKKGERKRQGGERVEWDPGGVIREAKVRRKGMKNDGRGLSKNAKRESRGGTMRSEGGERRETGLGELGGGDGFRAEGCRGLRRRATECPACGKRSRQSPRAQSFGRRNGEAD